MPETLGARDVGHSVQRIHRSRVGGSGGAHHEPGNEPVGAVLPDVGGQGLRRQPVVLVHRDDPAGGLADARQVDRLADRIVLLAGDVDGRPAEVLRAKPLRVPGRDDRGQRRDAPAGSQRPAGLLRIADDLGDPLHEPVFHAGRSRRGREVPGKGVPDGRQVVAERRRVDPAAGHVAEITGRRGVQPLLFDLAPDQVEDLRERLTLRSDRQVVQFRRLARRVPGRPGLQRLEELLRVADGRFREFAAAPRVRFQRLGAAPERLGAFAERARHDAHRAAPSSLGSGPSNAAPAR